MEPETRQNPGLLFQYILGIVSVSAIGRGVSLPQLQCSLPGWDCWTQCRKDIVLLYTKPLGRFLLAGQEAAAVAHLIPLGLLYCTQLSKKRYDYENICVCCLELC